MPCLQHKCVQLERLLGPVVGQVSSLAAQLEAAPDASPEAERLQKAARHAVAVTARTTKAFSAGQTMKLIGCVQLYLQALQIFLGTLQVGFSLPVSLCLCASLWVPRCLYG